VLAGVREGTPALTPFVPEAFMQTHLSDFLDRGEPGADGARPAPAAPAPPPAGPPHAPTDRTLHDYLGDAEPAPRGDGGKARIMSLDALLGLACPEVLAKCLDGADFSAAQIREAVPQIAQAYANANVLGTALGDGVRGSGLRLWRGPRGLFRACRENAVLAAKRMKPGELDAAARKRGLAGIQELAQAIQRLPSAKPAGQS
jgi:hypothetical protein